MCWQPGNSLEEIEKAAILAAFRFCAENKTKTAQCLGIAVRTLDNKLEQYGRKEVASESNASKASSPDPDAGIPVESVTLNASQQSLSVRKREEIQKMSPKRSA